MTHPLSRLDDILFLTDGGLETSLIFHEGVDLPHFASIHLLRTPEGRAHLVRYFERYLAIARGAGAGFVLEAATWRASPDWAEPLGLGIAELDALNRDAIAMLHTLRAVHEGHDFPILVSGCIGPRGDGYAAPAPMAIEEADQYHAHQIAVLADAGADMITAMTITNVPEAAGIARAAKRLGLPAVISFTLETDGRLPTGDALGDAILAVDRATGDAPAYYMINCAHPSHFEAVLAQKTPGTERIRGLRANASRCSHAELDEAAELDDGDPQELGQDYARLMRHHPQLRVLGGCCGTDHRHVSAIAHAVEREIANPA
jgi:homocysteine S-methyltransferase